ncbi:juvenile hormone esterase precursor [Tribolium castaneum]|uniref:juvenile hormone esterase precursor n=1 Tax=Tribolium castaneum TaxID=7070 RepID=UPI0001DBB69E|nr:juvenile hormone esterase precursor [Tribolium castaneum]BAJ10675.1 juvenile hormone esterase [Tribolium castaneum]BAJ10676.1 juvenile hormone esterase [Tribolium castaneum]BAJ10677.1 juvenile hormone esterase [Tribolium castaneum]BAJ10678.1 juvenile hormone esterase [Tribolium castaneum]BAJ10679.1 juvenile hormone esterase [Tribolium castaneum]|eukprot:NP_001180223.1 juvenile hormone esterase precursor [Tribolium castaneum]
MKFPKTLFLVLFYTSWKFCDVCAYTPSHPLVYTKYGSVIGSVEYSRNSRAYMSFKGIPFAKPPVGDLRFKAPEPPEPWNFSINGTKDAPFCIQKNYFFSNPKVEGSEDCLYLNVYVPKTEGSQLLPVMVFIHWGGFFAGRGSSDYNGPEYIMDKDVILVTFNYRLGVFGFLSTLDDNAPGNFGLKDQVMALKFVHENIECFGGDNNRVTIFGQSAGSGSVNLHLISPASRGLFQQAISQSGAALDLWARPLNALQPNVTAALAAFTGCSAHIGSSKDIVDCLRKIEATKLAETADNFKYFSIEPLTPYSMVTEKQTDANPNPFLVQDPLESLKAGAFMKIPWMVGSVQDEGILRAAPLIRQPETLQTLNSNFEKLITQMLFLQFSAGANASSLLKNMTDFYLGGKSLIDVNNPKSVQGFINLYGDRAFHYGIYQTVILQLRKGHKPIWMYNFNYKGQYSYGDKFAATDKNVNFTWGVSHCDDLLYLFKSPGLFANLQKDNDILMSKTMVSFWTNFAIYGNPDPHQNLNWNSLNFEKPEGVKVADLNIMHITGNHETGKIAFDVEKSQILDRIAFWAKQSLLENFPDFG